MNFDIITEKLGGGNWQLIANKTLFIFNSKISTFNTDLQIDAGEKYIVKSSADLIKKGLFVCGDYTDENGFVYAAIYNSNISNLFDRERLIWGNKKESLSEKFNIGVLVEI